MNHKNKPSLFGMWTFAAILGIFLLASCGPNTASGSSAWKPGVYYINLPGADNICEVRQASQKVPNQNERCVSKAQYREACKSIVGLSSEALQSLARRNSGTLGRLAATQGLTSVEFGWGWPGGAQEDACYALVRLPENRLLPGEHASYRFRISSFQLGSSPTRLVAVDLE